MSLSYNVHVIRVNTFCCPCEYHIYYNYLNSYNAHHGGKNLNLQQSDLHGW
ncbi:hypothetical protein CLV51_104153 [Chitinophaga niastensis]|uniref:Uncharacterized protein n=1 Tax=Chitinophaga niastensis TaxID=536980 RepID=A0A2P8HGW9_CHINA|nr:hypothetical protein CLV51_104153 [Chitinophaga niastensis]